MPQLQGQIPSPVSGLPLAGQLFTDAAGGAGGGWTKGAYLVTPLQAQPTIVKPWTLGTWSIQMQFMLLTPFAGDYSYGLLGKIFASLLFGQYAPAPGLPFPGAIPQAAQQNLVQLFDGSQDPPPPSANSNKPQNTGWLNAVQPIQLPTKLSAGDQIAIGVWLTPSLLSAGAGLIVVYNANYSITYQ